MKRHTSDLAVLCAAAISAVLMPSRLAAQSAAAEPLYEITLRHAAVADAPHATATELAAAHGGTVVDVRGGRVTLHLSPTRARVVAADPRVEAVVPHAVAASGVRVGVDAETVSWSTGVAYTYDGSGNVRRIGSDSFVYDAVGRLVQSEANGIRRNYEYDAFGNRTKCRQSAGTANESDCQFGYSMDAHTNRINEASYDASGNVIGMAGRSYSYDALNMLMREEWAGLAREYIYTADDERIAIYDVGLRWRWTVRDTSGKVLREFTSANGTNGSLGTADWKWTSDYIWRDGLLLATRQIEPGSSTPVTYHYHLDHLGTPRHITDGADRVVGIHDYHAFGPEVSGGRNEPSLSLIKFTGHERDLWGASESWDTLDYMHARYYSPAMGRFLSPDPVISEWTLYLPQGWNRYSYVMNNPMRFTDPTGREIECVPGEKEGDPPICGEKIDVEGEEPKVEPQPLPPMVFAGMLPLETQQLRMRERDERERTQTAREQQRISNCFDDHRFSSVIGDLTGSETARSVTGFLEIGSEISLAGDVVATAYKATHTSLGNQPYASGMNAAFRAFGRAVGNPALGRSLTKFGDKATPAAAVFGAFTAAYNATTYIQCRAGLL